MPTTAPGLNSQRLVRLMNEAIERCSLDLEGAVVVTEAATGAYAITPVLAALAGAQRVYAFARESRYGSVAEVQTGTESLAAEAGVANRLEVITSLSSELVGSADIVTNSGHVRPIDEALVDMMKRGSVVPLMYEAWELRGDDVDLTACRERGVAVTGTNERHPDVDVFSFLGTMAVKQLLDAGICVLGSRVLLVCDNPFAPYIEQGLVAAGAHVEASDSLDLAAGRVLDAVLVALQPTGSPVVRLSELETVSERWPGAVIVVFWGDVDRKDVAAAGLQAWPEHAPTPGHMGILPSGVGPEPIVRLQTGSLKAAEAAWRHPADFLHPAHDYGELL